MVCKNEVSTASVKVDKKTGAKVSTYTTKRKCSDNPKAIEEDEELEVEEEDKEEEILVSEEEELTMQQIKEGFERFLKNV